MLRSFILLLYAYGSVGYGYDSAADQASCGRPYRAGRMHQPPCDLGRQGFCASAGATYPWHAVRRFIRDNQGLMRRMYGDQRHGHVLRSELDIDGEEELDVPPPRRRYGRFQDVDNELDDIDLEAIFDKMADPPNYDTYQKFDREQARYLRDNIDNDDVLKTKFIYSEEPPSVAVKLNAIKTPHFRPTSSSYTTTSSTTTEGTTSTKKATAETDTATPKITTNPDNSQKQSTSSTSTTGTSTQGTTTAGTTENQTENTEPTTTTLNPVLIQRTKLNENVTVLEEELFDDIDISDDSSTTTKDFGTTMDTSTRSSTTRTTASTMSTLTSTSTEASDRIDVVDMYSTTATGGSSSTMFQESNNKPGGTMLFQDAEDQELKKKINYNQMKGVNACPVKEEVVAPFWANNTRGEVLALLNMYPFEQYVHWEKCTFEHRQMYCRDGCRCEQQYRLHRLLAYDPNNECRGIFSDWFRFPSCCVCKCYDMPPEFRLTSRSPRFQSFPEEFPEND